MAGLNFFHAVAQALEAGKLFHIDLNDQKPGRFDQDLRFGSESIKPLFFLVKLLEESGYDGPRHFDAHAYRTEDEEGVWDFARGCMRTYLILKDEGAAVLRRTPASRRCSPRFAAPAATAPERYTRATRADDLKAQTFDRAALAARRLPYERLDQLVVDLLLGVRERVGRSISASTPARKASPPSSSRSIGDGRRVVFEPSLSLRRGAAALRHAPRRAAGADPAVAVSSPLMWAEALDRMIARLAQAASTCGRSRPSPAPRSSTAACI